MEQLQDKSHIIAQLENLNASAFLGIDGMVDEVWELVASRASRESFTKV